MSWYSKVVWSEGLFLRPHHMQQHDRYFEHLVEGRTSHVTPYPWGFSTLEVDDGLAEQGRFALRGAAGVLPDGTPFRFPMDSVTPVPFDIPEDTSDKTVWLILPAATANAREVDDPEGTSGSRFVILPETLIDAAASVRVEEEIDVAHPRLSLDLRGKTVKAGHVGLPVARIRQTRDKALIFDTEFVPPILVCGAHKVMRGLIDQVIGWIETKIADLARLAPDPKAGGGLQSAEYLVLLLLNRHIAVLRHFRASRFVHPERLYVELLRLVGELATFASADRKAKEYPPYDHDDLKATFEPIKLDLQEFLSIRLSIRPREFKLAAHNELKNYFFARAPEPTLFQNADFVLEVSAKRRPEDILKNLPNDLKLAPWNPLSQIVQENLSGVPIRHQPTPSSKLHVLDRHVYFELDKKSPLWPEFSKNAYIGVHVQGELTQVWPDLKMTLWAISKD